MLINRLSNRMKAICSMVPESSVIADIGCDHGYVSLYLVDEGITDKAIACDVNKGPLAKADENIKAFGFEDRIETRLSDGLEKLGSGEADTVIIAGMGGALTKRILEMGSHVTAYAKCLVLQPQSEIEKVRSYIYDIGFYIQDEEMLFEDGKYYTVIKAERRDDMDCEELSQVELEYGPVLLQKKHPVLKDYLLFEENICKEIENSLVGKKISEKAQARLKELETRKALIREAKDTIL